MSTTVRVDLGERAYNVRIGIDLDPGASLAGEDGRRALVVSDSNVDPLYGERCETSLKAHGLETFRSIVAAGENSKKLDVAGTLYDQAVKHGLDRSSVVVALGGGVVGDLAGFVAATFLRGVRYVQVPTSLLAMVDSSVGGKTGVNLSSGKNLVGSFHQPIDVAADLATLATLPEREYRSGLAEVVKYGVIWDAVLFATLEEEAEGLLARETAVLEPVVARCCAVKAEVVVMDERESGVRAALNFGHTLGHALEHARGYGDLLHGEAVAIGMAYAARLSERMTGLPRAEAARVISLLDRLGLPTVPPEVTWAPLRAAMSADKKALGRRPRFVLAERLGSVVYGREADEQTLEEAFGEVCRGDGAVKERTR